MSTGSDKSAGALGLVQAPNSVLERLQRRIVLECSSDGGTSFRTKLIILETTEHGTKAASVGTGTKASALCYGTLERGHGAPIEAIAQLDEACNGVCALTLVLDAAEFVSGQAAKVER